MGRTTTVDNLAVLSLLALLPLLLVGVLLACFPMAGQIRHARGLPRRGGGGPDRVADESAGVLAASIEGLIVALTLLYIVFGALLLLSAPPWVGP